MQGFNMGRYVPPDVEGVLSFNQASGKKPTNRKSDGTQVVRFECPFPIWCTTCNPEAIIGQGVRFNAEKKKVGNYFSTPVWSFRFKHTVCGGWIEVKTDPKNTEYVVVEGGRRRAEKEHDEDDFEVGRLAHVKDGDVLGQLEKKAEEKGIVDEQKRRIEELKSRQERDWADPYEMNKRVRREFRVGRRQRKDDEKTGEGLKERFGLGLDLVAPIKEDGERAKLVDFRSRDENRPERNGLFEKKNLVSKPGKQRILKGKHNAAQKSALHSSLKGNTRARTDPFLRQDQWLRKAHKIPEAPPTNSRGDKSPNEDAPGNSKATGIMNSTNPATLVAYDSD